MTVVVNKESFIVTGVIFFVRRRARCLSWAGWKGCCRRWIDPVVDRYDAGQIGAKYCHSIYPAWNGFPTKPLDQFVAEMIAVSTKELPFEVLHADESLPVNHVIAPTGKLYRHFLYQLQYLRFCVGYFSNQD